MSSFSKTAAATTSFSGNNDVEGRSTAVDSNDDAIEINDDGVVTTFTSRQHDETADCEIASTAEAEEGEEEDDENEEDGNDDHFVERLHEKFSCSKYHHDDHGGNRNRAEGEHHHHHHHHVLTLEECRRFYDQYFMLDDADDDGDENDNDNEKVAEEASDNNAGGRRNNNWSFGLNRNNNKKKNQKKTVDKMKPMDQKKSRSNWRIQKRSIRKNKNTVKSISTKKKREQLELQVESDIQDYIEWRTKCGLHLLYDGENDDDGRLCSDDDENDDDDDKDDDAINSRNKNDDDEKKSIPLFLLDEDDDSVRWDKAFEHGLRMSNGEIVNENNNNNNKLQQSSSSSLSSLSSKSFQVIFQHRMTEQKTEAMMTTAMMTDKDGYPIFHVLPARIYNNDTKDRPSSGSGILLHDPPYVYSIAFAAYLDMYIGRGGILSLSRQRQGRQSGSLTDKDDNVDDGDDDDDDDNNHDSDKTMKRTVLFDVRPGKGWPNPPVLSMINMIRTIIEHLQGNFPGRLHRLVIYPIPRPAMYIWNMIKFFFKKDKRIVDRIVLVPGQADQVDSPLPTDLLSEWFDDDVLQYTEEFRTSLFVDTVVSNE